LTVKEIADVLSVNADYLSHRFRQEMGLTCIAFLNLERVRQAAALLRNTELQIQQIALLVGYNNTSYFARQFKLHYRTTPLAYRSNAAR
jgi:two-component system response regulator YesN